MMSSRGSARRASMIWRKYSSNDCAARAATSRSPAPSVGSSRRARCADHALNRARSSGGTPSISAMTITGSGVATASVRSNPARSPMASSSAVVCARICGSSPVTVRRVNALLTKFRSRVWSGESRNSME